MLTTPNLRQLDVITELRSARAMMCWNTVLPSTPSHHSVLNIPNSELGSQQTLFQHFDVFWVAIVTYSPCRKKLLWLEPTAAPIYGCNHSPAATLLTLGPLSSLCMANRICSLCVFGFRPLTSPSTFVSYVYLVAVSWVCLVSSTDLPLSPCRTGVQVWKCPPQDAP